MLTSILQYVTSRQGASFQDVQHHFRLTEDALHLAVEQLGQLGLLHLSNSGNSCSTQACNHCHSCTTTAETHQAWLFPGHKKAFFKPQIFAQIQVN